MTSGHLKPSSWLTSSLRCSIRFSCFISSFKFLSTASLSSVICSVTEISAVISLCICARSILALWLSYSLRWMTSFYSCLIDGCLVFAVTIRSIFRALVAYFKVFNVSSWVMELGDMHATMAVRVFPPRESLSSRVSLESRYGTKPLFFSLSEVIQFPRVSKERLIFEPYILRRPRPSA